VQHKCGEEKNGYALGELTSREIRIQRGRPARATVAAMCQPTGSSREPWRLRRRVSGAGSRLGGEENDAWKGKSRRWSGDGGRAAAGGAVPAAEQRGQGKTEQRMCSGRKKRGEERSGDLFAKQKNYRDSLVN
jgi:hypothetical protein